MEMLKINQLYEHPQNPRQEVGDVTELAESIKANGIFQNLTVISGGPGVPEGEIGYTVIIGHRRLAASKLAGITELPCSVVEMTEREQISTMLLENMQRTDLTTYEQAQGFQMMLDLGETQQSISALTGFSEATVCRRLKLLALDKKKFKAAEERGGTLEQYIKVAEIKNAKVRQKVLDTIGTNSFDWQLNSALKEQKGKELLPKLKKELRAIATEDKTIQSWSGKYEVVKSISISNYVEGEFRKLVKKNKEYFWNIDYGWAYLYVKKPKEKAKPKKKSAAEIAADSNRKQLETLSRQAYELRRNFIENFFSAKKCANVINDWLWESVKRRNCGHTPSEDREFICAKIGAKYQKYNYYIDEELLDKFFKENPSSAPAIFAYFKSGDSVSQNYYYGNYGDSMPQWESNKNLDFVYEYLCKLGYQMSEVELQLQKGTHELFGGGENR